MSHKNRNMNDINDQKTAEQQAFSEEIRRRLAEPGSGKPTLDEFKVMVYKDREKRRKKRNALVACIVAAFIVGYLTYDDLVPEVGADKNPKETIQTEDGVIIEDGGWGSYDGEDNIWTVTKWEQVEEIKALDDRMLIPEFIPDEYEFEKMTIEALNTGIITYEFLFENNGKGIEIELNYSEGVIGTLSIENVTRTASSSKGKVFFQKEGKQKKATIQMKDGSLISVWYVCSDEDIIDIIENLN